MVANYGNASGHVPPIDLMMLADKGSLSAARVGLFQHITNPKESCAELFDLVRRGILKVKIGRTYALRDAATGHRDIENRESSGSTLLLP